MSVWSKYRPWEICRVIFSYIHSKLYITYHYIIISPYIVRWSRISTSIFAKYDDIKPHTACKQVRHERKSTTAHTAVPRCVHSPIFLMIYSLHYRYFIHVFYLLMCKWICALSLSILWTSLHTHRYIEFRQHWFITAIGGTDNKCNGDFPRMHRAHPIQQ